MGFECKQLNLIDCAHMMIVESHSGALTTRNAQGAHNKNNWSDTRLRVVSGR